MDLFKKRLNPYSFVLKILSKLILWTLVSEKRRRRILSILRPALKLYGKLLLRTTRGLYGVALLLLAYLVVLSSEEFYLESWQNKRKKTVSVEESDL